VVDASELGSGLEVGGEDRFGFHVLTVSSAAVANGITAICLAMRDEFGLIPHIYVDWTEGSPLLHFLRFILRGSGQVAPVTREVLRCAEPDRSRLPHVHVGSPALPAWTGWSGAPDSGWPASAAATAATGTTLAATGGRRSRSAWARCWPWAARGPRPGRARSRWAA
jgi:hypothetical protein